MKRLLPLILIAAAISSCSGSKQVVKLRFENDTVIRNNETGQVIIGKQVRLVYIEDGDDTFELTTFDLETGQLDSLFVKKR